MALAVWCLLAEEESNREYARKLAIAFVAISILVSIVTLWHSYYYGFYAESMGQAESCFISLPEKVRFLIRLILVFLSLSLRR